MEMQLLHPVPMKRAHDWLGLDSLLPNLQNVFDWEFVPERRLRLYWDR